MKRKKSLELFVPFTHNDVDTKNSLLNLARELANKEGVENLLSSTMIFAGITEYLAQHLLMNLRYLIYNSAHSWYGAIIFLDQRDRELKRGLGETVDALREFEFPDKQDLLRVLQEFNNSRTHFFHEFININSNNVEDYMKDINIIRNQTEELINKLNVVYAGLGNILIPQTSSQPVEQEVNAKTVKETKAEQS